MRLLKILLFDKPKLRFLAFNVGVKQELSQSV